MLTQNTGGLTSDARGAPIHTIPGERMGDPWSEQPSVDARGIRPPSVYAIEVQGTPDGVVLLALEGEFDLAAAPAIRERLDAARAAGARGVVLDMSEATFVDSSALRELLRAEAALHADGVPLVLAAVRPPVARLLELTQTTGLLTAAPTVEAALQRASA
jgi:anti-sigma B factor antagonist